MYDLMLKYTLFSKDVGNRFAAQFKLVLKTLPNKHHCHFKIIFLFLCSPTLQVQPQMSGWKYEQRHEFD
jgi:hypothetical protein